MKWILYGVMLPPFIPTCRYLSKAARSDAENGGNLNLEFTYVINCIWAWLVYTKPHSVPVVQCADVGTYARRVATPTRAAIAASLLILAAPELPALPAREDAAVVSASSPAAAAGSTSGS